MAYRVVFAELASDELLRIHVFERRRIIDQSESQLSQRPEEPARPRKKLGTIPASFEYVPPLWELRIGEFRVFYDADVNEQTVYIRAVRRKRSGQTTEDVINE
jgi:mRNA-degrading endonuclease RelE of RelBE toxin-antitoxin system